MTAQINYIQSTTESLVHIRSVKNTITFHIIVIFVYSLYLLDVKTFPTLIIENYLLHSKYWFYVTMVLCRVLRKKCSVAHFPQCNNSQI